MRSSPLHADGKVYAFSANGRWAIYEPDDVKGATVVSKGRLPTGEECHGSPICSHGRFFFQSTGALYCLVDPDKAPGVGEAVEQPVEPEITDQQPSWVQVVPAEVLMKPGEDRQFSVHLYNSRGQYLSTVTDAEFALEGDGHLTPNGRFTAPKERLHQAAVVTATVGSITGRARIRVVPELPWRFDFADGQVPITWVGARYRHIALDDDLLQSLNAEDAMAGQLYIYLASAFTNTGAATQTFDNSTPQQKWTAFQRFVGTAATTLEQAKELIDPSLETLIEQDVLASREWQNDPDVGIRLTVEKGPREFDGKRRDDQDHDDSQGHQKPLLVWPFQLEGTTRFRLMFAAASRTRRCPISA